MVLPLLKVGALFVRTASKPLANAVKARATKHPRFRDFIIYVAQVLSSVRLPGSRFGFAFWLTLGSSLSTVTLP